MERTGKQQKIFTMLDESKDFAASDPQKAAELAKEALQMAQSLDFSEAIGLAYLQLGQLEMLTFNHDQAIICGEKALSYLPQQNKMALFDALNMIGTANVRQGNNEIGVDYLHQAMEIIHEGERANREEEPYRLKNAALQQNHSEQKAVQAESFAQTPYFKFLLENNPLATLSLSAEEQILDCNRAFEELFGYEKKHILHCSIREIFPSDIAKKDRKLAAERVRKKEIYQIDTQRQHNSGAWIDVRIIIKPVIISNVFNGLLVYFLDIRDQVEKEKGLEDARRFAEQATKAKSEFLANMSHEIRTPLNGVIGMTNILIQSGLSASQTEMAQIVAQSGKALLEIVNNILDLSKIEASKLELDHEPLSIRQTVEDALDIVAQKALDKGLDVGYIEERMPPLVYGDSVRLQQILVNLLSNGIKFTDEGEVIVFVNYEKNAAGKMRIQFDVRDSGIGIPKDRIAQLFLAFSQVDASMVRKYGGTGLGLTISHQLVEMMGGKIWVSSEVGVGSTFSFDIVATPLVESAEVRYKAQDRLLGKQALIIEDSLLLCTSLERKTAVFGIQSTSATDSPSAIETLQAQQVDIIILDLELPHEQTAQFLEWVNQLPQLCNIPIIGMRGVGERDQLGQRIVSTLTKPIRHDNLRTVLIQAFSTLEKQAVGHRIKTYPIDMDDPGRVSVLLVEDDLINCNVVVGLLKRMGFRAQVAGNGEEALAALENNVFDLVLMDVYMPKMDGIITTTKIYERFGPDKRPYIIAITANAFKTDRDRLLAVGMDDYLSKPIRIDQLVNALNQFIHKRFPSS